MAATLSPTPLPSSLSTSNFPRRPSSRQTNRAPTRPYLRRGSPISAVPVGTTNAVISVSRQFSAGDSSDDDVPAPIKFSAVTKALLGEDASALDTSPGYQQQELGDENGGRYEQHALKTSRSSAVGTSASADQQQDGSPAPRVVRVGSGLRNNGITRSPRMSFESIPNSRERSPEDLITPAPRKRSVLVAGSRYQHARSPSVASSNEKSMMSRHDRSALNELELRRDGLEGASTDIRSEPRSEERDPNIGAFTTQRARAGEEIGEELGAKSTLRIKRVGKMTGSFLSGPARRGMTRRQSEEDNIPLSADKENHEQSPIVDAQGDQRKPQSTEKPVFSNNALSTRPSPIEPLDIREKLERDYYHVAQDIESSGKKDLPMSRPNSSHSQSKSSSTPASGSIPASKSSARANPVFKVPPLPDLPSRHDQENEPPPTFKRSKPQTFTLLDKPIKKVSILPDESPIPISDINATPATMSPRKALAPLSHNTPHRAAPPPPKMTVLETATATAGAATASQARKKRNQIAVNGKVFTRMDCIGRGGSSKVYRVMAENYKIFAVKRVSLEDVDPSAIRGYKGEIDLLRSLSASDRVIKLWDWEINDDKHALSMLMELGESDLNKILSLKLNPPDTASADEAIPKFDINFTRYYWAEMLHCVRGIHAHGIVHSDLKPANFLLCQGRLKLIDFGIANAIEDDTVNVHRETQIGTPNYMSPEALVDCNARSGTIPSSAGKCMKLGRPSDVWSLGCILYQMVYGKPPFAYIAKPFERIMAIPNPKVAISFPELTPLGNVSIPPGLHRTLKRCLERDQAMRPTVEELLSDDDPFLHPDRAGTVPLSRDLLAGVLANVFGHCRTRVPSDGEIGTWADGYYERIKKAMIEEGIV